MVNILEAGWSSGKAKHCNYTCCTAEYPGEKMAKGLKRLLSPFCTPWQRTSATVRAAHLLISTFSLSNYYVIGLPLPTSEMLDFIAQILPVSESTLETGERETERGREREALN